MVHWFVYIYQFVYVPVIFTLAKYCINATACFNIESSLILTIGSPCQPTGKCTLRNVECGISKRCILRNFNCEKYLLNKVHFAELKLRKMFLLLSYVN